MSRTGADVPSRILPPTTMVALVPGVLLTFVGMWMLTDGGPLALGWAAFGALLSRRKAPAAR